MPERAWRDAAGGRMLRRRFRREVRVHRVGDLRRAADPATGRVVEFGRAATPTVDALLGRSDGREDPEIAAAVEAHGLLDPLVTRRESLVVTGAAAGLISTFVLPPAVASASTGVAFADTDGDGGAVASSVITVEDVDYDLYEVRYTPSGASDNATVTRGMTLGGETAVDLLLLAGGGSGGRVGSDAGGGGGAGQLVIVRELALASGLYTITVGAGGAVPAAGAVGNDGVGSGIRLNGAGADTVLASGGGGGGGTSSGARGGGSAGGGTSSSTARVSAGSSATAPTTGTFTSFGSWQRSGGLGVNPVTDVGGGGGGGGGGAATIGADGSAFNVGGGGAGGAGRQVGPGSVGFDQFLEVALEVGFGGGGGGLSTGGNGRTASDGNGGSVATSSPGGPGVNGRGDGGGGGVHDGATDVPSGRGGTGVVYVRIPRT